VERHGSFVVEPVGKPDPGSEQSLLWRSEAARCSVLASGDDTVGEVVGDGTAAGERLVRAIQDEDAGGGDCWGNCGVKGCGIEIGDVVAFFGCRRIEAVTKSVVESEARSGLVVILGVELEPVLVEGARALYVRLRISAQLTQQEVGGKCRRCESH
jgi:hypothetical protein